MKKNGKKILGFLIVAVLAVLIILRFLQKPKTEAEETRPTIGTACPEIRDIVNTTDAIGSIEPQEEVDVMPKMSGEVTAVNFAIGDRVEEGQVLVTIHSDALDSLKIQLDSAKINMDDAQTALSRTQALFTTGAVSKQQLESAESTAKATKLAYESAKTQLDLQTGYTEVKAPIAGVVESKNVNEHDQASPAASVCTISGDSGMSISFGITGQVQKHLNVGDPVTIEKNAAVIDGTVTEISEKISASTGLYECKASVGAVRKNADGTTPDANLSSGAKAKLVLVSDEADKVLTVPLAAVSYADGKPFVYLYDSAAGTAVKTDITTGLYDDTYIEVTGGLKESDPIIVTWSNEIYNGAEVLLADSQAAETTEAASQEAKQ